MPHHTDSKSPWSTCVQPLAPRDCANLPPFPKRDVHFSQPLLLHRPTHTRTIHDYRSTLSYDDLHLPNNLDNMSIGRLRV